MDVDNYLDMASLDKRFTFKVDGKSKTALTTLLFDDLINYRDTIGPGETKQAVIVIEMSSDDAASIGSVTMKIKAGDEIYETTLL